MKVYEKLQSRQMIIHVVIEFNCFATFAYCIVININQTNSAELGIKKYIYLIINMVSF